MPSTLKSLARLVACCVFLLMAFGGLICLLDVVPIAWGEISTSYYEPIEAKVIDSTLEPPPIGEGWRGSQTPSIAYQYVVKGKTYVSTTIGCNDRVSYSKRSAKECVTRWSQGTATTAYVCPWKPESACLKRGSASTGFGLLGMFLLGTVVGAVGLRKVWPRQPGPPPNVTDLTQNLEPITVRYQFTLAQLRMMTRAHLAQSMYWVKAMVALLLVTNLMTLSRGVGGLANTLFPVLPVLLAAPLMHLWSTKNHFESRSDRNEEIELVIDSEGVKIGSKMGSSSSPWKAITSMVETRRGYLIYFNAAMYQWLPKGAFESPDAERRFKNLVDASRA